MTEPFGHRGHPSEFEVRRARRLAIRIERAVARLEREGFDRGEAIAFIAGIAYVKAQQSGETWASPDNAIRSVEGMIEGRAAKEWGISAVVLALFEVVDLMGPLRQIAEEER